MHSSAQIAQDIVHRAQAKCCVTMKIVSAQRASSAWSQGFGYRHGTGEYFSHRELEAPPQP